MNELKINSVALIGMQLHRLTPQMLYLHAGMLLDMTEWPN